MTTNISFDTDLETAITVDVFTEESLFESPPIAKILTAHLPPDSAATNSLSSTPTPDHLTKPRKQQIAREFNFSETVFLSRRSPSPLAWAAEIFTPEAEMVFAGHPVIGTGHYLFSQQLGLPPFSSTTTAAAKDDNKPTGNELTLHTAAGPVTLHHTPSTSLVRAAIPHAVRVHGTRATWTQLLPTQRSLRPLASLSLSPPPSPSSFPTVSIVRGVTYVLVDLSAHDSAFAAVAAGPSPAGVELDEGWAPSFVGVMYYRVLDGGGEGVVRLQVRMVAIGLEDPACGSRSGALCAYLALQRAGAGARRCRFELEQGLRLGGRASWAWTWFCASGVRRSRRFGWLGRRST